MNKKGQVLVLFALLLPIVTLLLALMIDTGFSYIELRKIDQITKETISYGLDHIKEENIKLNLTYLINQNIKDIYDMQIEIDSSMIHIQIEKKQNTIFSKITKNKTIKQSYQGTIIDGKKEIKKE